MVLRGFIAQESGAVSVDWVVLSAACVSLGLAVTSVTATAMGTLSTNIRAELMNTDPNRNYFDELMNLAIFSEYNSFSSEYGTDWGEGGYDTEGQNWAQLAYDAYAGLDDQALMDQYLYDYEVATTGDPLTDPLAARSVDHIAIQEYILNERGLGIPEGNSSADEVRAGYTADDDGDDDDD